MTSNNTEQDAHELLQRAEGRATPARLGVLGLLLSTRAALSHHEIEQRAMQQGFSLDRVTLYRTLDWLVEQGVAHKISGADRTWRYNAQAGTPHQHAHFHCKQCGQVFCLENLQPTLLFGLSDAYQIDEVELNLQGRCPDCANKATGAG